MCVSISGHYSALLVNLFILKPFIYFFIIFFLNLFIIYLFIFGYVGSLLLHEGFL